MRPEDILDAIGEVDEVYIREAKQKKSSYKWIIAAAAACLALALAIPALGVASNSNSAEGESARDEIWNEMAGQQENQDIALETGVSDQKNHPENWCQAEIHEYGSETVMAYGMEKSMELQAVLEQITAEGDGTAVEADLAAWGYVMVMKDADQKQTMYILQDNCLYDMTNQLCYLLDDNELAKLKTAMDVK